MSHLERVIKARTSLDVPMGPYPTRDDSLTDCTLARPPEIAWAGEVRSHRSTTELEAMIIRHWPAGGCA
jgi:hypothetical protein